MVTTPILGHHYTGNGYPWDLTPGGKVDQDLRYFKSIGVTWIRPGIMPYSYSKNNVENGYKAFIEYIINWDNGRFKVMTGVGASIGFSVYQDWWTGFKNSIESYATWAEQVGLDVFCIGNEEASHNFRGPLSTPPQVINNVTMTPAQILSNQQVHDDVRGVIALTAKTHFSGPILYTGSEGEMPEFIANGIGNFDILGHNQYNSQQLFLTKLKATYDAFGQDTVWVTEWSDEGGFNASSSIMGGFGDEYKFSTESIRRWNSLLGLGGDIQGTNTPQNFYFQYGATKTADSLQNSYGLMGGTAFRSTPRVLREELIAAAGYGRVGWTT